MLAQNFVASETLGITDAEHAALIKTLAFLERGEASHCLLWPARPQGSLFNMDGYLGESECGTVGCIAGWAYILSDRRAFAFAGNFSAHVPITNQPLMDLFHGGMGAAVAPETAACALRNYLTLGEPRWPEVLAARS